METLKEVITLSGTGLANLTAKRVANVGRKYVYLRSDGYYEVFIAKEQAAGYVFETHYPDRHVYPNNEDFGITAWTYKTEKSAMDKFNTL